MPTDPEYIDGSFKVNEEMTEFFQAEQLKGKETYQFEVGQTVWPTESCGYILGVEIIIRSRYMQNGYCYYEDHKGVIHRTKDLSATKIEPALDFAI